MTTKKLKSIDIINVLSDLVSEKMETTVKLPICEEIEKYDIKLVESFAVQSYNEFENYGSFKFSDGGIQHDSKDRNCG